MGATWQARAGAAPRRARAVAVFLLDDREVVRRGVRELLDAEPDIAVVGEAGTAQAALARMPALRPDVAVLDFRSPGSDGVSACRAIRSRNPETACLMLTSFADEETLLEAVMAGAAGYVLRDIRGTGLAGAVRATAAGEPMIGPGLAGRVLARAGEHAWAGPLAGLTRQERHILELIGAGLTNRQIGERVHLAEKTVRDYVSVLFAKLGKGRRGQASADCPLAHR
ncbi:MAG: response regulator transcription factor [Streptosporangiaceae bacterium]